MEEDRLPEDWHNSPQVAIAGGIAAVVLLCLLIYAVVQVSDDSVEPSRVPMYPTTSSATPTTLKTATSTTSYSRTSVETSEPAVEPPPTAPTQEAPADEPTTTEEESTTTQSGNAGSI